ncbi:MAG: glycerophosphodiester phosphodiesterase [Sphaerochaetaceae bacterium]|nr:glycerophosphodiester phosphodiesterase [Spirochaetales bacterium]MDY5500609.1 glycerophosphodiester phosphodiesterase [Sphaerochaetaceae bacterium]
MMTIVAHRGYSGCYPENTMLSFQKAVEAKTDEIELDVQLTKDHQVVVIHDEKVDRTTDGVGNVRDFTLKEIQKLDASKAWNGQFPSQHIPSFEEYCEWASGQPVVTNIELKTGLVYYPDIEQKAIGILEKYHLIGKVMFSSFNHLSLVNAKQICPEIPVGALVGKNGIVNAGFYCKKFGFEFYHPSYEALDDGKVKEIHDHGIKMNVWTVNGMCELEKLQRWGARGVITNFPTVCRAYVRGLGL